MRLRRFRRKASSVMAKSTRASISYAGRLASAITQALPTRVEDRVHWQEAIAKANRHGEVSNAEAIGLLKHLDRVSANADELALRRKYSRKRGY